MRDRRVYVGNLSYDVKWTNLKDFMRQSKSSFNHGLFYFYFFPSGC
jgi:RNA recognition motif-containing protein